jgi:hypothetical protein
MRITIDFASVRVMSLVSVGNIFVRFLSLASREHACSLRKALTKAGGILDDEEDSWVFSKTGRTGTKTSLSFKEEIKPVTVLSREDTTNEIQSHRLS